MAPDSIDQVVAETLMIFVMIVSQALGKRTTEVPLTRGITRFRYKPEQVDEQFHKPRDPRCGEQFPARESRSVKPALADGGVTLTTV